MIKIVTKKEWKALLARIERLEGETQKNTENADSLKRQHKDIKEQLKRYMRDIMNMRKTIENLKKQ